MFAKKGSSFDENSCSSSSSSSRRRRRRRRGKSSGSRRSMRRASCWCVTVTVRSCRPCRQCRGQLSFTRRTRHRLCAPGFLCRRDDLGVPFIIVAAVAARGVPSLAWLLPAVAVAPGSTANPAPCGPAPALLSFGRSVATPRTCTRTSVAAALRRRDQQRPNFGTLAQVDSTLALGVPVVQRAACFKHQPDHLMVPFSGSFAEGGAACRSTGGIGIGPGCC